MSHLNHLPLALGSLGLAVLFALSLPTSSSLSATFGHEHPLPLVDGGVLVKQDSLAYADMHQLYQEGRPEADLLYRIASHSVATWYADGSVATVRAEVGRQASAALDADAWALMVLYNMPGRGCGSGGMGNAEEYGAWIAEVSAGIGQAKAIVVLEPDALSNLDCLSAANAAARRTMLRDAIATLKRAPHAKVLIDVGHPGWHPAAEMVTRLAGVAEAADGVSINVSNFVATVKAEAYGFHIWQATELPYVVDTSRNGAGAHPDHEWCNPPGRALGAPSHFDGEVDLLGSLGNLWIKVPGESDGTCHGGPAAGAWWRDYALDLARASEPGGA